MTSANPLTATSLLQYIASSLPKDAQPQLKSATDAVAIACHAGMLAVGFKLVGLGEDHRIEAHSDPSDAKPLPAEWNASAGHAFRYKHPQSSMEYLLKVNRLGNKTVVYGIGMGDDKTTSFDLTTADFISESALPATPSPPSAISDADIQHSVQNVFISPSRLSDLGSLLRINIIQKLMPSLQKEGYEEDASTATSSTSSSRQPPPPRRDPQPPEHDPLRDDPLLPHPARPNPLADPSFAPLPRRPVPAGDFPPPGFEDEYEINQPPRGYRPPGPGMGGYPNIGERDLYPQGLGPRDPFSGGVGPGLGGPGGGGMHPTFDDPLFAGPRGGGGAGFDPQAPPGARYDPPFGPGSGRGGGPQGRGGFGGAPPNPFGGFGSGDFI